MSLPSHALASATATDRAERLGWLLLIPLGCLVLGQALLALHGIIPVLDGGLGDPDAYMRLNRVVHLYETGAWFDPTYPRINPPDGHVQHWTRPLDALLLAGAWLLEPFLGFRTALHVWGVLFSPICLALSILALNWATAPVLDRDGRMIACLLLLLQPTVMAYSSLGRADHHSLLFVLFILMIGLIGRIVLHEAGRWTVMAAGAVAALGLWVSSESLVAFAAALGALGVYWLVGGRTMAAHSARFAGWTTGFLALALLLERGPDTIAEVETDRLSILHVLLAGLIALFWTAMVFLERHVDTTPLRRALAAMAGGTSVAMVLLLVFPEIREGPLGEIDPLYDELRLGRILEVQPLIPLEQLGAGKFATISRRIIQGVGLAVLALPFLMLLVLRRADRRHRFWVGLAVPLAMFLPLAVYQVRWSSYAQILLVIPYSALIGVAVGWLSSIDLDERWRTAARPLMITAALLWPVGAIAALPPEEIQTANQACPLPEIGRALDQIGGGSPRTIMALADYGPELLYRTAHRVLSIPNHRPQPGFTLTHRVLTSTDERSAREHIARSDASWILLCPSRTERSFFDTGGQAAVLYRRLVEGKLPAWVRPIDLPDGEGALLFATDPHMAAPGRDAADR